MKGHTKSGSINLYDYLALLNGLHTKLNGLVLQLLPVAFRGVHLAILPLMLAHDKALEHILHHYG
ncbi:Uncharacterised protein [Acinetobacter baumannii]|nr:Uncharacterised protein [Acinetobacter baumannii]